MTDSAATQAADLEQRCVNTIRFLAVDAVQKANSGHPGLPMGMAPVAYTLWTRHLRYDPSDPDWPDRDRFVLSAGHGSALLYAMLHLTGYEVTLDDLKQFRQWGSITPGHPEHGVTPGVETTTGPLGQGLGNAVGMAMAEAFLAATFNREGHEIVDHRTYVICGDGDMMEGVSAEAASLAGHLGLGKLTVLYDDNRICLDGSCEMAFTEDVVARFDAYGWHTQHVADANDVAAVHAAMAAAKAETERPSFIAVRSHIGYGSPNKQDSHKAHGAPLGVDEVKLTKENLGWPLEPDFYVPDDVREYFSRAPEHGGDVHAQWDERFAAWRAAHADLAQTWDRAYSQELAPGWEEALPVYKPEGGDVATRSASGAAMNALAPYAPTFFGGSADLKSSTETYLNISGDFEKGSYGERNVWFGVREHAMSAACNGMALHGGVTPFGGTFFVFTDYHRPSIRLGALMGIPVKYVYTHDSVGVGEDGPTHQPIEHLAILRATPGFTEIRPADANETVEAWKIAMKTHDGPVGLVLTRQKLPTIDRDKYAPAAGVARGAYVLADSGGEPDLILMASGSEVQWALGAWERLSAEGVACRVVDLASWALFERQDADYQESVLPDACHLRLAVEMAASFGWDRWVGRKGEVIGIDHFGASAPAGRIFQEWGFTVDNVYARAKALLERGD